MHHILHNCPLNFKVAIILYTHNNTINIFQQSGQPFYNKCPRLYVKFL